MTRAFAFRAASALLFPGAGCAPAQTDAGAATDQQQQNQPPAAHPPVTTGNPGAMNHGRVLEAIEAGSYTYVRIEAGGKEAWLAGPRLAVDVGAEVVYGEGMPMNQWHSESLDRTWDQVLFVSELRLAGAEPTAAVMPAGHPPSAPVQEVPLTEIEKLADGHSVEEVFARRADLAGAEIGVRGQVVKVNFGIMGKNWFHLRDGSGSADAANNDLTVTSPDKVEVGQVVTVRGTLAVDKDFGAGYRYPVILEDARLWID
jgi:hypothetical protein